MQIAAQAQKIGIRAIEKITVGQVCELAGYNRGTFYLHFQDLYEMLEVIEDCGGWDLG